MGGQTALNCALSLNKMGVLEKFGVEMIGAKAAAIDKAEDRELFREAMARIGLATPRAAFVNMHEMSKRLAAAHASGMSTRGPAAADRGIPSERPHAGACRRPKVTGLPAVVRPSFTLGGTGGGIAYTIEELYDLVLAGVDASPTNEVLIEESVAGWKEFEMEVVRDRDDNCIIVCSIENVDPMGVHTGNSITVAPALTLTDKEYQLMRDASIAVLREIGVETGGSNVQFAINPEDGRMVVIEMNPRVSRSSALASKATGFPIAKVAARLAVGYTLDELENDITHGAMPAAFEPTIDYVVTKIPRFAFEKFPGADPVLTTSMKSVGEVMAIGRTFAESLQKALRGLETGLTGLDEIEIPGLGLGDDKNAVRAALAVPRPDRLLKVAQALRLGFGVELVHESCRIDPWFLREIQKIVDTRGARAGARPAAERKAPPAAEVGRLLRCAARHAFGAERGRGAGAAAAARRALRSSSASTPAPPSSPRRRPTCIRPTRRRSAARRRTRRGRRTGRRSSSWAAGRTASARASSSTIAAATPPSRWTRPASNRSWSTATRRPCRPTTTPPTGSISSRSPPRTCWRSCASSSRAESCSASSCSSAGRRR